MDAIVYVWLDGEFLPAGRVRYEDLGNESYSTFAYGRGYLKRRNAVSIDPVNLPLHDSQFETLLGFALFGALRDAGPDRWGRHLVDRRFGRSPNEFEYVLATATERSGALAFGPDVSGPKQLSPRGYEAYRFRDFDIASCMEATDHVIEHSDSELLKQYLEYGPSLGGARPKAAVRWKGRPYVAKFSVSLDSRNEPLIEYGTMLLAKEAGLNVPPIDSARVLGRDVFLSERFDREEAAAGEQKRLMLSGLTATSLHEADYSSWSYEHLCQAIRKISSRPKDDMIELYRRMIFNILVHNDDDHLRNFAFVHESGSNWRLSPLYDVVPRDQVTRVFRSALRIGDFGREASKANALSACRFFNIASDTAAGLWQELESRVVSRWREVFREAGLRSEEVARFEGCIGPKESPMHDSLKRE
jgi:serine/threonine-protein kinase HipA